MRVTKKEKLKTLFVVLPARLYISDVLHTPYIKELAKKYRVVVFLPTKEPSLKIDISGYFEHPNVTYHGIQTPSGRYWTIIDWLLRAECIRRYEDNPAVVWRNEKGRKGDIRRRILHRFMQIFPKRMFSTDFFSFIERLTMPNTTLFEAYIQKYRPSLVMTATPGLIPVESYVIACAHKQKIPTVAFDFSWDNLSALPRHVRKTKYLICWNEFHREQAKVLHDYSDTNLFVAGTIRFDHYFRKLEGEMERKEFLTSLGLDPSRKTVLFAARSFGTFHKDFIHSFILWQNEDSFREPLNLFVRIHPLDSADDYEEFMDVPHVYIGLAGTLKKNAISSKNNIETEEGDWVVKKDSISHTDIGVNVASTFSIEEFIFDKPVVNIGFINPSSGILTFPHYTPIVESGAARIAQRMEDVLKYINLYLEDPTLDKNARAYIVKKFVSPTDGYSYKRNVGFIDEIIEREYGKD